MNEKVANAVRMHKLMMRQKAELSATVRGLGTVLANMTDEELTDYYNYLWHTLAEGGACSNE